MCRLRLAFILIFTFTWHPLKAKIPGEQVSRGLLSWDYEKLFQFIPKEKFLLSTGVGWRALEKSRLDCSGDGDGLIFLSNSGGGVLKLQTFHLHYRNHMHQVRFQSSDLWCFLFHILEIQKSLIFERLFFLQSVFFLFCAQFC